MTYLEAIAATIEPYSVSDESLEKALIDASERFGTFAPDETYSLDGKKAVALASMLCLAHLRVLHSENIGGISNSYAVAKIEKSIRAIANDASISADLVLAEDGEDVVTCVSL